MVTGKRGQGVTLYYRLMSSLKENILGGRFAPGDRLPSEVQLVKMFQMSRVVVRQALAILEREGLIVRLKGKGTFVATNLPVEATPVLSGYIEDFLRVGLATKAKILEFGLVNATAGLASALGVGEGTELLHVKRLRSWEGRPLSIIENYVPFSIGALVPPALLEEEPLMQLVEKYAGVKIDFASEVLQAISADAEMASLLDISLLAPVLKMSLTAFSMEGQIVNLATVYYRSDRYNHRGYLRRSRRADRFGWIPTEEAPTGRSLPPQSIMGSRTGNKTSPRSESLGIEPQGSDTI